MSDPTDNAPEGDAELRAAEKLEPLRLELEESARRLKDGQLSENEAAALVERLADIVAELGRALDREASAGDTVAPPGQEPLL